MNFIDKAFPRPPRRIHRRDDFWKGKKKPFVIAVVASSFLLQILFLLNFCYLYGSLFRVSHRAHDLNVLFVDYDGGVIGKSVSAAASSLEADTFPEIKNNTVANYPDPANVYEAIRRGDYWAGLYTHVNASDRLATALQGNNAAIFYNTSDVITFVWNEARYAAASDSNIEADLEKLIEVARISYNHINGTGALQSMNQKDPNALQVLLYPWAAASINIQPTTQGDRVLYNTVTMVLPIIMQFFCLMAINGISAQFSVYSHLPIPDNAILRNVLSSIFTFVGSLCLTGAIWAFKEGWAVSGGQFMCTWLILWLYMHINFLVMDVATAFIAQKFLPFFVITWVIVNVTSTIFPFELNPSFYRIGYAFPAHETWQVLVQIFSGGAVNRLYQALPILFVYEIVLLPLAKMGMHYRCIAAVRTEQEEEARAIARYSQLGDKGMEMTARTNSVTSSTHELKRVKTAERRQEDRVTRFGAAYWPSVPVPFGDTLAAEVDAEEQAKTGEQTENEDQKAKVEDDVV